MYVDVGAAFVLLTSTGLILLLIKEWTFVIGGGPRSFNENNGSDEQYNDVFVTPSISPSDRLARCLLDRPATFLVLVGWFTDRIEEALSIFF